jgi:NAD(P)H dehydrogenase (quinone)
MSEPSILVTGASGHLGRRVIELLLEKGARRLIATTRKPDSLADLAAQGVEVRRGDFEDEAGLADAFKGAERVLLVSTDALDRPGRRLAQHHAAVRALAKAGATYVVYTSLPNPVGSKVTIAGDHAGTEEAIAASGIDFTILRNNLYSDYFPHSLAPAVATGRLVDAKGKGAIAWVTREDCAQAAAGAILAAKPGDRITVDVTGPSAVTSEELATLLSAVVGKSIVHAPTTPEALVDVFASRGMPRPVAELMASFDAAVAKGDMAAVTSAVQDLSRRTPTSVKAVLEAHAATLKAAAR